MLTTTRGLFADPLLRLSAALAFLMGLYIATLAPYQPLLAVTVFGLGHSTYAAVLVAASVVSVTAAVLAGILADQKFSRRRVAVTSAGISAAGATLMWLVPSPLTFALVHAAILPAGGALFGQIFALARLATRRLPAGSAEAAMSAVRATFAFAFVMALPVWAVFIARGVPLTAIYPVMAITALVLMAAILAVWPEDASAPWGEVKAGLSIRRALGEFADRAIALRVLLLGALQSAIALYIALVGLVFHAAGAGDAGAASLFVALVAGFEVPLMLAVPRLLRIVSKTALIAAGAVTYAAFLALLPLLAGHFAVWLLVLPGAIGGAAVLTLPISYLQDQMTERPGAGSSLMSLQKVVGDAGAAACFAAGTAIGGYTLAALCGALLASAGGLGLYWVDRRQTAWRR